MCLLLSGVAFLIVIWWSSRYVYESATGDVGFSSNRGEKPQKSTEDSTLIGVSGTYAHVLTKY